MSINEVGKNCFFEKKKDQNSNHYFEYTVKIVTYFAKKKSQFLQTIDENLDQEEVDLIKRQL